MRFVAKGHKPMSEPRYAKLILRLSPDQLAKLEARAKISGATPREYIERQEQRRLDQKMISRATWIDLRAAV